MIAEVIVDISNNSVDKIFDYIAPDNCLVGCSVLVPFGKRTLLGFVLRMKDSSDFSDSLKSIIKVISRKPLLKSEIIDLSFYMAKTFYLRMNDCLKLMVPNNHREGKSLAVFDYILSLTCSIDEAINKIGKRAKKQIEAVVFLSDNGPQKQSVLNKLFSSQVVNELKAKGLLSIESERIFRLNEVKQNLESPKILNEEQTRAVKAILSNKDNTFLLFGVTGSGKTEVYLNIIKSVLDDGKNAIMLVPEISLTPLMVDRFKKRFGSVIAVLHSGLNEGERYDEWERIYSNKARVIIGARSAIFAPVSNLGAIIIDEEHDSSYISESNPRFDTHVIADFRARYNHCPLILGSATPKLSTYKLALDGKYKLLELKSRVNDLKMPEIEIVDMTEELRQGNTSILSAKLQDGLIECKNSNKQAIIFLNRRGYASFQMCKKCGYIAKCEDCAVSLVYHKQENVLKCHFCGKKYRVLDLCPNCGSDKIKLGSIGTEQVVDILKEQFKIPVFRMDNDSTRTKDSHKKILEEFSKTSPSILVGTQMIAKGHDFPLVNFVGILDADISLYTSDYTSAENTFQLVTQVAGRAGRKSSGAKVVLQTYTPNHYVYQFAKNYDYLGFYKKESNLRETTNFPPYAQIIRILISSENREICINSTKELLDECKEVKEKYKDKFIFLQAMPAPIKRIKTKYRFQIILRFFNNLEIEGEIAKIQDRVIKGVSIFLELNPTSIR